MLVSCYNLAHAIIYNICARALLQLDLTLFLKFLCLYHYLQSVFQYSTVSGLCSSQALFTAYVFLWYNYSQSYCVHFLT